MSRDEAPPFARGETFYNGEIIDVNNLGGVNIEGKEYVFEVNAPDDNAKTDPSGRLIRVRVARNVSGGALKGKRVAHYKAANGVPYRTAVDGYCYQAADLPGGVIDEFLPPGGVPNNDLFFVVVGGPSTVISADSGFTAVAVGDQIQTAAGTGRTTADSGKVTKFAASPAIADLLNRVGYADVAQAVVTSDVKCVVNVD